MSVNASEARLSSLTRSTFLSMWSYQNPHYAAGKELCDVLVIFGDQVILMSDKLISYGTHDDPKVNWSRWYKKAVASSVRQLVGAKRQLMRSPTQVFADDGASAALPLELPPLDRAVFHLVAVANGSGEACTAVFGSQGLNLDTQVTDDSQLLTVGVRIAAGEFVHILNEFTADAIFEAFDTARDFVDYLTRKEVALSDDQWLVAGEENLIAAYLTSQPGNRPFVIPTASFPLQNDVRLVPRGLWDQYRESSLQEQRAKDSRRAQIIDQLIEHVFNEFQGQALIRGQDFPLAVHAEAWILLASESRASRQLLSAGLLDILNEDVPSFWCTVMKSIDNPGLTYVFLTYPEPPSQVTDDQLERAITDELSKYMVVAQMKFSGAKRLFGMCLPGKNCNRSSRVFQVRDGSIWTDGMQQWAEYLASAEGVLAEIDEIQFSASR